MISLSESIVKLFDTERFYAEIIASMRRVSSKKVPLAGVCIKDVPELHINPEAFSQLSVDEGAAVLKHECEHLLRGHIQRSKELAPEVYSKEKKEIEEDVLHSMKHKSLNIAADMAINPGIQNLPQGGVYPKLFDLPDGETMEWYMQNLKNNEKAKSFMEYDGHEIWGESEGQEEIIKEKIRKAITEAAQRAKAAGRLTAEQELLVSQLNTHTVDWKAQLRRFVARSLEIAIESSKKKRNRRYGIMYPGTIKTEVLKLGVAMDTSGSVSDEALQQFMAEIHNISKYAHITVVEADSEIKNIYDYDPKKKYAIKGRGGTAYKPVFDYFNKEGEIDGVIYFGDMDTFDKEELIKPKYPVLWAIVGEQEPPADFGSRVYVKV